MKYVISVSRSAKGAKRKFRDTYSSTPGTTDAYTEPATGAGADLPSLQTNAGTHDLPQRTTDTGLQIDFQGQAGLPEIDHDVTTADALSIDYMMFPDDTDAWMSTTTMTTQPQIQGVLGYYTVLETRISLLKEVVDALPEHDKDWAVDRLDALVAPEDNSSSSGGGETTCSIDVEVVAMIDRASPTPASETWTWTDLSMAPSKMVFSVFAHLGFVLENGGPIQPCLFTRVATLIKRTWPGKRLGRFEELAEDAAVIGERENADKGQFLPELRKEALQKFRSHEDRKERQDVEGEERGTYVPMFQEGEFRLILDGMRQYDEMYFAALSAREGHRDVEEPVG
ncbi:hypothetical protein GTA08_BOTSDO12717 [Botryosphaeria dothidea]|uniref:Uncharacterized protein n=1 Tax=Botryosphaeria dothidea TaxID=55169 RepID=A0A8H4N5D4_9PEZI|nr:hypothetical protein GTA08_BOTSDO12717 [Botryosphaeria dothidea]